MTEPVLYNYQQQKTMCMNSFSPSYLAHCPLSILPLQFPHVADVLHLISDHRCSALKLDRLDEYVEKVSMYNCSSADTEQSGRDIAGSSAPRRA